MASIKTNVAAFQAQAALKRTSADVTKTMERLSTGYKINQPQMILQVLLFL